MHDDRAFDAWWDKAKENLSKDNIEIIKQIAYAAWWEGYDVGYGENAVS